MRKVIFINEKLENKKSLNNMKNEELTLI